MNWAALGAAVMVVASWLGQTGGVRFDADPGVCEPGDTWVFTAAQPVALPWPVSVACRKEVGGLPPGMYRVTITSVSSRLPPRSVLFRIASGRWTTVRLAFPAVVVRGRVLSHGEPVAGVVVQFSGQRCSRASLPTDSEGAYVAELCEAGDYQQSLRPVMARPLPPVPESASFALGDNLHDFDVSGGRLRVWFTELGSPITRAATVQLMLQSLPSPAITSLITTFDQPVDFRTLAPGRVEGAQVFAAPMSNSIRSDADGRVSLAGLSPGLRVVIRTRTWGMSCHRVTEDALQRVVVTEAPDESVVVWRTGPPDKVPPLPSPGVSPLAGSTISGLPGASCAIPYEAFPVATARVQGGLEHFFRLPRGTYTLTLKDGKTVSMSAPGRVELK